MEKALGPEPGPYAADWAWLDKIVRPLDEDFLRAVSEEVPQQERPELDELFPE
jgi:antitoxin VapB